MIIHPSCGEIAPVVQARLEKLAAPLRRGATMPYRSKEASYWIARDAFGGLRISMARDENFPKPAPRDNTALFHALWKELEDGADTPQARLALAVGMLTRIPCGTCRPHWAAALHDTPPGTETAEAFRAWVDARHNEIARRLGKPEWPLRK